MSNLQRSLGVLALTGAIVAGSAMPANASTAVAQPWNPYAFSQNAGNLYWSGQAWCSRHSLTCAVATGIGIGIISPWLGPARN